MAILFVVSYGLQQGGSLSALRLMRASVETANYMDDDRRSSPVNTVSWMIFGRKNPSTRLSAHLKLFCPFFEWATLRERSLERAIFCAVGLLLSSRPRGSMKINYICISVEGLLSNFL